MGVEQSEETMHDPSKNQKIQKTKIAKMLPFLFLVSTRRVFRPAIALTDATRQQQLQGMLQ